MSKGKALISGICIFVTLGAAQPALGALPVLKNGSRGDEVSEVQTRLKQWGYYHYSQVTGYYGSITTQAVKDFQVQNGLVSDGIVGKNTYSAMGIAESSSEVSRGEGETVLEISSLLKKGTSSEAVRTLQVLLMELGYYHSALDGVFGSGTDSSVRAFQTDMQLKCDGIVGQATCSALNDAVRSSKAIELLDWWEVDSLFARKTTATLTDVWTGLTIDIYRLGGTLHADVEPCTAADTALLKQMYPVWSWGRRPVIIEVDGMRIAGSMNGMPHGQQDIYGNDYDGQFCVHFLNSRTHGGDNVDPEHQAMIQVAYSSNF